MPRTMLLITCKITGIDKIIFNARSTLAVISLNESAVRESIKGVYKAITRLDPTRYKPTRNMYARTL